MKNTFALLCVIFSVTTVFSQINIQWESRFNNPTGNNVDYSKGIVLDNANNIFVTGTSFNGSNFDIVTVKYAADGTELWVSTFNGAANGLDETVGLEIDSNGDILVAGIEFKGGGDYDPILLKYNNGDGSLQWMFQYSGTNGYDQIRDMCIDNNNNTIIVGSLDNSGSDQNFLALSINTSGTQNWSYIYDSPDADRDVANAVTSDAANNVYLSGESENTGTQLDFLTVKLNSSGAQQWSNLYDGNNFIDSPKEITLDNSGNVLVTGTSYQNVVVEEDIATIKIDVAGNLMWDKIYSGSAEDFDKPNHITTDNLDYVYVSGKVKSTAQSEDFFITRYSPVGNQEWVYLYQSPAAGYDEALKLEINNNFEIFASGYSYLADSNHDYLVLRLDTLSNLIWETRFDGPANNSDQMVDMQLDDFGNIFITGSSKGSTTNRDYSTIKYCQFTSLASNDTSICIGESVSLNVVGGANPTWESISGDVLTTDNFSCTNCTDPMATPSQTSVYTVSSVSPSGCIDYDTVTVTINPLPGPAITVFGDTEFCIGGSTDLAANPATMYNWNTGENTQEITVDTSGTYSLTVTDEMGCENSTNVVITVYDLPMVGAGNDIAVCPNTEITLEGSGANSYNWSSIPSQAITPINGTAFTPTTNNTFEVIGTDVNGCANRDTMTVTLYPFPAQVVIDSSITNYSITSNFTSGNIWYFNGADITPSTNNFLVFYNDENHGVGEYYVEWTDDNGCKTISDTIVINADGLPQDPIDTSTISVYENIFKEISLYPNPTEGNVVVESTSLGNSFILRLSNNQGKVIWQEEWDGKAKQISILDSFASGIYSLSFELDKAIVGRKKIIKL